MNRMHHHQLHHRLHLDNDHLESRNDNMNNNNSPNQGYIKHRSMLKADINNYQVSSKLPPMMPGMPAASRPVNDNLRHNVCYEQKCLCCPYGFHIDLDFLRYLESLKIEMQSRTLPRKNKTKDFDSTQNSGIPFRGRSAFSEDECTFASRDRRLEGREDESPDSARGNLSAPSKPYVVNPKAEPDVLVAIPDDLKLQRTELYLDPEVEKKFHASARLFIDQSQPQVQKPRPNPLEIAINGHNNNQEAVKFRKIPASGRTTDESSAAKRHRSSIAIVIEHLENCLGTSPTSYSSSGDGREDEVGQLTQVQLLCSRIIAKLRRLHELEERVKLMPDQDEHILSLTRQLDQLKMKHHQQKLDLDGSAAKTKIRAPTRDVGVGNSVVFVRPGTGGSTSPTFKRFADISVPPLPPSPIHSSHSKKVREVSVQVNSSAVPPSNERQTSEKKFFMNFDPELRGDAPGGYSATPERSDKFCCKKCGSLDVAKLEANTSDVERGVSRIIESFNKTFQPMLTQKEGLKKKSTVEGRLDDDLLAQRGAKKVPPATAPKPKVSQKSSSDPEIINGAPPDSEVKEDFVVPVKVEKSSRTTNILVELLKNLTEEKLEERREKVIADTVQSFNENADDLIPIGIKTAAPEDPSNLSVQQNVEVVRWSSTADEASNLSVENLQTFACKPSIASSTTKTTANVKVAPNSLLGARPMVVDLMESSSGSEDEGSSPSRDGNSGANESSRRSEDAKYSYPECLVSEITVEENDESVQVTEKNGEVQNLWIAAVSEKILAEAMKEATYISRRTSSRKDAESEDATGSHETLKSGNDADEAIQTSSSSSSSSSSTLPRKLAPSVPVAPNSSLADVPDAASAELPQNATSVDPGALASKDISNDVRRNLFASTLTREVILATTSDSSEAENWGELSSEDASTSKQNNPFLDSHKLFLKAASGKMVALSDPGDLWKKNKSVSSEFPDCSSEDDYGSSSCCTESEVEGVKSKEELTGRDEKASGCEIATKILREHPSGDAYSENLKQVQQRPQEATSTSEILTTSILTTSKATSDNIVTAPKIRSLTEKIRPISFGAVESEGIGFVPLGSPSSEITSQSMDAGINEQLASIRGPCEMSLLKSPVPPTIKITSPAAAAALSSFRLSSNLSLEDEEINNNSLNMTTSDTGSDGFKGCLAAGAAGKMKTEEEKSAEDEEDCFLEACVIYANWLTDPTSITDSEKDAIVELIRKDWFLTSGRKMSQGVDVCNALSTMHNFGDLFVESVINMADADGNTTLHYSVSHSNGPVIEVLLETGLCDADRQNNAGYTPTMLAALLVEDVQRNFELLKSLFDAGDINAASDRSRQTALMLASSHGREEMVSLLLECGADINIQDEDGSTALMCASEHGHAEIIKILLAHPLCNSSLSDIDGSTALSIAMEEGNHDIGILIYAHLKAHGAIDDEEEEDDGSASASRIGKH